MKRFSVLLSPEAERDLEDIYRYVRQVSTSSLVARQYINRVMKFLATFDTFPERGSLRNDIRSGLRVVGFERNASVAFVVESDRVIILSIAMGGKQGFSDDG
jgi:toxin ParE1/3/4